MIRSWEDRQYCSIAAAIIGTVGATIGGVIQAGAAKKAANDQVTALGTGQAELAQAYQQNREDISPFIAPGAQDFATFNKFMTDDPAQQMATLQGLPGYQFALTQGEKAVQNSASARGLGVSGAAQKGAAAYATGLANEQWQSYINPLLQGSALGEQAAQTEVAAGSQYGANVASLQAAIGQAKAGGAIGVGNAFSGIASSAASNALLFGTPGGNALLANMYGGH